jgi:acyl-CoA synthetase (NDP forming)
LEAAKESPAVFSRSSDRMLRAIAHYTRYGRLLAHSRAGPKGEPFERLPKLGKGPQPEWLGKKVFAAAGIRVPDGKLAHTADEAVAAASRIGYPVALKAQAAALTHKTEVGGLMLNLVDSMALRAAWAMMLENMKCAAPHVALDGILVEKMSPKGVELMIGAKRDQAWGTVLLVGLGGIWVEALVDLEALNKLRASKLLTGFRGMPPADVDAVAQAVLALGRLMQTTPDIVEIDINPLMVHAKGEGATALDALIVAE